MNNRFSFFLPLLVMILILSMITVSLAQKTILFNPRLDHFLINKGGSIPSSYAKDSLFSSINYKNRMGVLSDIRDIYFDIATSINNSHIIGAKLYSEQETSLFTKSKIEAIYAFTVPINENLNWALGTQFGGANINFGSTGASVGGSDWSFDIAVSTTIQYKKIEWGIAMLQLPNSKLQPLDYTFLLERYFNSYISSPFNLSPNWVLETGFEIQQGNNFSLWSLDNKLQYNSSYGLLVRFGDHYSFSGGAFMEIPMVLEDFFLSVNYSNFFRQEDLRFNSFSISIYYQLKR